MNYAIQSETYFFPYLEVTSRKRAPKHSLIRVESGLALFKLGKQEYAIEPNQAIWIPIDCLCSLSFFPNTTISRVDFSVRLRDQFPHQSGFIKLSNLSFALLERLKEEKPSEEVYPHLLQVLKDEVKKFEPKLIESPLTKKFANWQVNQSQSVSKEHHIVLLIREAMKRKLSGAKTEAIVSELFSNDSNQYEQMCQLVVGQTL